MSKLLLILLGSLAVLIQTWVSFDAGLFDNFWVTLALVVGGVSAVLSLILLIWLRVGTARAQNFMHVSAAVLVLLWMPGTAAMTVKDPYTSTGNGYFGAWAALIFSWLLAAEHYPSIRAPLDGLVANGGMLVAMLTLASLVVFCQTFWLIVDHHGFDSGEAVWLFVCSGFSLLILVLLHVGSISAKVKDSFHLIAIFLFVWWTAGWFVGTFDAPYFNTGNGFFGCWVALFSSFLLADTAGGLRLRQRTEGATSGIPRALLGLTLGSAVALVAISYKGWGHGAWWTWAFVCSCVSTALCVFLCIATAVDSGKVASALRPVSLFLLLWWIAGTGIMTFEHPFTAASNGYFGAWIALVFAAILCYEHAQCLRDLLGRFGNHGRLLVLLLLASATLMTQVLFDSVDSHKTENIIVAWIVAGGTLAICLVMMLAQAKEDVMRVLMVIKFSLWTVGVAVLTFDGPYGHTGNAYFACWFGFALSALAVWRLYPDCVRKAVPEAGEPPASVVGVQVAV